MLADVLVFGAICFLCGGTTGLAYGVIIGVVLNIIVSRR